MDLPAIIPRPRRLVPADGICRHRGRDLVLHPDDAARAPVAHAASTAGLRLRPDPACPPLSARLGEAPAPSAPARAQGYALRVAADGIALAAHDAQGLAWAVHSLRQVLADGAPPCLELADWPEYRIRYHHDDVSRKQVSTMADFRRILRHLAALKISHYTPYLEDMVLLPEVPLMGEGRGAFTPAQLRELAAEGARVGVEVFPTLSLAGHQENLLRLPRYRALGARSWQPPSSFDPRHPGVRDHLRRILDAVCPCFASPFFHMCFDEVIGLDADAFAEHAGWCVRELVARGRIPLFWADMLYNHFGEELLARLPPEAVPVAWEYATADGKARAAVPRLLAHRPEAWILGGACNWGSFLHAPIAEVHTQLANWRAAAPPERIAGFGISQWGDDGYENSRDLAWPIFAVNAEQGWSGADAEPATCEARFHHLFHGDALPALAQARRLLEDGLAIPPGRAWSLHRLPAPGWVRLARAGKLPTAARLAADGRRLAEAARLLAQAERQARRERGHLVHLTVAIARIESVRRRALAARDPRAIPAARRALAAARKAHRDAWLTHNRPEGLEVSLAVFDAQDASWRSLAAKPPAVPRGWRCLDLGKAWNRCDDGVAGLPIGHAVLADVPFRFAPVGRTHGEIPAGKAVSFAIPPQPLRDLHLAMTQPRRGEERAPAARLRLLRRGHVVYEEELLAITHLCDWWAPLGQHMWAGGGLAYVDPMRVRHLLSPREPWGVTCLHRFPWPVAPVADRLELACLAGEPLQLFAATLELAAR